MSRSLCDARYPSREDVYQEFHCAGALREHLQKEIALVRVQLGPTESAHGFGDTVSYPFSPWLQLTNRKECLYMHLVRHHGPERRFICSGTKQPRVVMALHAELVRCSVGPLSCTRRLRNGREYRVPLTASGPKFVCKDVGSGAVAARRVGKVFYDRGFADVFFRHLMQTGGRMHMTMNRLQCDIQLQGCQQGHTHPELVAEDIGSSPDVSAWKSALYDSLRSADGFHVLSLDGTMKIAMGVRRRALDPRQLTALLTTSTLQGALLDIAVVPSDGKHHVVVSARENALPPDD